MNTVRSPDVEFIKIIYTAVYSLLTGRKWNIAHVVDCPLLVQWAIELITISWSSQFSTTGVKKSMVYTILSMG